MIFRKSDAEWKGTLRGWELMLSYSFDKHITTGDLQACGRPAPHPLLLPVLVLCAMRFSSVNDERQQREQRSFLRNLENALSQHHETTPAAHPAPETEAGLDALSRQLADCQCEVLRHRPQAWRNVIKTAQGALRFFWQQILESEKGAALKDIHQTLESRLDLLGIKLEGVEEYAHVTLERLSIHRGVLVNVINQRETRLNPEKAVQQRLLAMIARASARDSAQMKTLTVMGLVFLPGTFLSSVFGMPFFHFDSDMSGPVSKSLWIYFILMVPLTALFVGAWRMLDQRYARDVAAGDGAKDEEEQSETETEQERESRQLEARVMRNIRRRTVVRVADTLEMQASRRN